VGGILPALEAQCPVSGFARPVPDDLETKRLISLIFVVAGEGFSRQDLPPGRGGGASAFRMKADARNAG
jgi:hypothetical protein